MNKCQRQLIILLSRCIRGQEVDKIGYLEFKAIYEEAQHHQVHTLLYPALKKLEVNNGEEAAAVNTYRKEILRTSITQELKTNIIKEVFLRFNEAGIQVVLLKGLFLRELYPYPNLRTMCDIDILIHKEHKELAKDILYEFGYVADEENPIHIQYVHNKYKAIEVHTSLINKEFFKAGNSFEETVWENAVPYDYQGCSTFVFSNEDQLLYLLIHMVTHFVFSGFGIRQVCDLVLLIEAIEKKIDWERFYENVRKCGIERFVFMMFLSCRELFDIAMPLEPNKYHREFERHKDEFIDKILSDGVYGRKDKVKEYSNRRVDRHYNKDLDKPEGRMSGIFQLLFPPKEKLADEYKYVKKYPFLLPVAVIHRLLFDSRAKNYNVFRKFKLLIQVFREMYKKNRMLRWLKLNS